MFERLGRYLAMAGLSEKDHRTSIQSQTTPVSLAHRLCPECEYQCQYQWLNEVGRMTEGWGLMCRAVNREIWRLFGIKLNAGELRHRLKK
jgi:hypothetical protein